MTDLQHRRMIPFVDLRAQRESIDSEVRAAIDGVLERGDYILGQGVADFERSFADYCGVRYGIGVDNGTSGLDLAIRALDIGRGDEVITAANSFIASALAIAQAGASPVLVDIDPATNNMDPALLEAAITDRTKAIMPVHLYGHPADMDPINEIARRHGIAVLEDASQAHGARYKGERTGGLADVAVFSLYPSKNLGAYGDAGIVVTDSEELAEKLYLLRNWGSRVKYEHLIAGFNRRMDTIQASVLSVKLPRLDAWNASRRRAAARYDAGLASLSDAVTVAEPATWAEPVYHVYPIRLADRDGLQRHLAGRGISTVIHYPIPIHLQGAFDDLPYGPGDFPHTEALAGSVLSLPMFAELSDADIDYVVDGVRDFLAQRGAA